MWWRRDKGSRAGWDLPVLWSQTRVDVPADAGCPSGYALPARYYEYFKTFLTAPVGGSHVLRLTSWAGTPEAPFTQSGSNADGSYYSVDFAGNASHWCAVDPKSFSGTLVYATVDGSYIRVEADTVSKTWVAFLPNGTRASGPIVQDEIGHDTDSSATQIMDRNGKTLAVTGGCAIGKPCSVRFEDAQGRGVTITHGSGQGASIWSDTIASPGIHHDLATTVNWGTPGTPGNPREPPGTSGTPGTA